ncbi:head GIN domain-containing protein [Lutimonas halocynthiae]|uniref:head GIN domain-containing protein n=1 Tax=Lutimonas halocynthiae TaxID=1446477 RepID=UPI0025B5A321|nr:head GIN domain-containing protein [Lutimonas halocynthiae]MDN3643527.1 head GIN domain-containing protein [Lutimonas halocynthiae]
MKNFIKLSLVLFLLIGTTSCMFDGVRGDGEVVSKSRKISDDFVRINASRGLDVYITKSKKISLEVEADENLHELIETEVKNGTLYITTTKNIYSASAKKIHLSVNHINAIHVNSGAEVYSENTFSTDKLVINVSSGAHARMDLKVDELTCESSSGSEIRVAGETNYLIVSSSSGSDIDAYELKAKTCKADASSGSDIHVYVTESFEGSASSGADIQYKGNPEEVNESDNSGGNVRRVNG